MTMTKAMNGQEKTVFGGSVEFSDETNFIADTSFDGNLTVNGNLDVTGSAVINGDMVVTGELEIRGDLKLKIGGTTYTISGTKLTGNQGNALGPTDRILTVS